MINAKDTNKEMGTLFKNKLLEGLTKTSFPVILCIYLMIAFSLAAYGYFHFKLGVLLLAGFFFVGLFSWTLFEYLIHRYFFHFVSKNKNIKRMVFIIHGIHHEYSHDPQRFILPPIVGIPLAFMFFLFFRLITGNFVFGFFPGFLCGYLLYETMHYAIHSMRAPAKFLKRIWTHHLLHHYQSDKKGFGVSSPLWDFVFRTLPEIK